MKLNGEQRETYREKGYVLLPRLFSSAEVAVLEAATIEVLNRDGPEVVREADGAAHIVYGAHLFDDRLWALSRHPRIVGPLQQLSGSDVFVHQSRINAKQPKGATMDWHQDFGDYHRTDGVPEPRGIVVAVFLDEITACNAPLMCVPGSQREGLLAGAINPDAEDHERAARYRYDISQEMMADLVERYGLEAVTGPVGSVLFMDGNVVHGSTVNITPLRRAILYVNVTTTDNSGGTFARPEYYAARDFSPLQPLDDDCLMKWRS